jgi:hypothetical protein
LVSGAYHEEGVFAVMETKNLEIYNKTVEQAIKKFGPNASRKSINRVCHSMNVTKTWTLIEKSTVTKPLKNM